MSVDTNPTLREPWHNPRPDVATIAHTRGEPITWGMPKPPPPEIPEVWDHYGTCWGRTPDGSWTYNGWTLTWAELLDEYGPVTTTPPAGGPQ